jgi:hypothetical protein
MANTVCKGSGVAVQLQLLSTDCKQQLVATFSSKYNPQVGRACGTSWWRRGVLKGFWSEHSLQEEGSPQYTGVNARMVSKLIFKNRAGGHVLDSSGSEQGQTASSCQHRTLGFHKILGISW